MHGRVLQETDWNQSSLRDATMIGSQIKSDRSLDFLFLSGIEINILFAFVLRKLQTKITKSFAW